jgi:DNA-binding NarL/FixJ family response regulator
VVALTGEKTIEIIVVHGNPLRGDCLTRTLAAELKVVVLGMRTVDDLASAVNAKPVLVILDIRDLSLKDLRVTGDVGRIRTFFPEAAVAVISDKFDTPEVMEANSLGLRAYISSAEKLDIVVAAVHLILAGGKYYSNVAELTLTDAAKSVKGLALVAGNGNGGSHSFDARGPVRDKPAGLVRPFRFTSREAQVLECLQHGFPNKAIASKLCLSENTVKVHLRRIMRKLRVRNRTEAALSYRSLPFARDADAPLAPLAEPGQVLFQFRKDVP